MLKIMLWLYLTLNTSDDAYSGIIGVVADLTDFLQADAVSPLFSVSEGLSLGHTSIVEPQL